MIHIELIEVLQEYRNGNKDILNTLYSDKVKYCYCDGMKIYDSGQFLIIDEGIARIINTTYRLFTKYGAYKKQGKYYEQVYCGTKADFQKDTIMILLEIFNDITITPATSSELYGLLKYKLKKFMNNKIKISAYSISDVFTDNDNEECSYYNFISQMPDFDFSQKNEGYIGEMKELMDILRAYDIKDLCSSNATAQKDIIDLLKNNYKYRYYPQKDCCELPKDFEMISMYQLRYGKEMSQQQYSAVLDELFKILCDCTSDLKGVKITRKQYCNAKQRGDIYSNTQTNDISNEQLYTSCESAY